MQFLCFTIFGFLCGIFASPFILQFFTEAEQPELHKSTDLINSSCITPNGEEAKCIPIGLCPIFYNATFSINPSIKKFLNGSVCGNDLFMVCCGSSIDFIKKFPVMSELKQKTPINVSKTVSISQRLASENETTETFKKETPENKKSSYVYEKFLPSTKYCGLQHWDDYLHAENETNGIEANVDEFPWLVAVVANNSYRCSGFLISNRFFLTTLGCSYYGLENRSQSKVLLGLHHIRRTISCISTRLGIDDCTDGAKEVNIDKKFEIDSIVLVKLAEGIQYSDFVRPICLPFQNSQRPKINDTVMISGWGKLSGKEDYVVIKKRNIQRVVSINDKNCKHEAVPDPKGAICTLPLQNSSTTACSGDSGGPIMHKYGNNWFAAGITIGASKCVIEDPISSIAITPEIANKVLDHISDDYYKIDNSFREEKVKHRSSYRRDPNFSRFG